MIEPPRPLRQGRSRAPGTEDNFRDPTHGWEWRPAANCVLRAAAAEGRSPDFEVKIACERRDP